jgi:hypothetical protein
MALSALPPHGSAESGEYADIVVGQDGTITVTVAPTRSPDIQLSWLMVARQAQGARLFGR